MTAIVAALFVATAAAAPATDAPVSSAPAIDGIPAAAAAPANRFNGGEARFQGEAPASRRFADGALRDRMAEAQAPAQADLQMDGPRARAAKKVIGAGPMSQLSVRMQVELTEALAPEEAAPSCPDLDEPNTNAQARAIAAACWDFLDAGPTDYVQVTRVFTSYARGALGGSEVWVRQDEPIHRTVNGVTSEYAPDALALFSSTYIAALKGQMELDVQTDPVDGHITRLRMADPGSQLEVEVQVAMIPIDVEAAFED